MSAKPTLSLPLDILRVALAKEKQAHRFYSGLLADAHAEILKELLEQLKDEEYRHIRLIENKIAALEGG